MSCIYKEGRVMATAKMAAMTELQARATLRSFGWML